MTKQEEEEIRAIVRAIAKEEIALASGERTFPLPGPAKLPDKPPEEPKKFTRRTTT